MDAPQRNTFALGQRVGPGGEGVLSEGDVVVAEGLLGLG